ncbi:MAG: ACT domain-containing protein [Clostridia bacterium]|nr:ACT domain-containing protein [Clostridia bacterium]
MEKKERLFLVSESALPEGMRAVCEAQELLRQGKARTVGEAVCAVGISRSAYYKYRDHVRPFFDAYQGKIMTLQAVLADRAGLLSVFLNVLAKAGINVLTVNQNIPIGGEASITLSLHTGQMKITVEAMTKKLLALDGVVNVQVVLSS